MFYRFYIAVLSGIVLATFMIIWELEPSLALAFGGFALLGGTWIWIDDRAFERNYNDET